LQEKPSRLHEFFNKHRELIMYCIFGVTTTIISWGTYWLFMLILPFGYNISMTLFKKVIDVNINIFVSNVISWIVAVSVAFVTNKLWVFESKSWERKLVWGEAVTFIGGRMLTGAIEIVALPVVISCGLDQTLFGVEGFPAKMLITMSIVILNYILSKFISFNLGGKANPKKGENGETNQ